MISIMRRSGSYKAGQRARAVSQSVQSLYGAMVVAGESRHSSPEPLARRVAQLQGVCAQTKAAFTPAKVELVEMSSGLQAFAAAYQLTLDALLSEVSSDLQESFSGLQSSIQRESALSLRLNQELKSLNFTICEVRSSLRKYSQQLQRLEAFVGPKAVA